MMDKRVSTFLVIFFIIFIPLRMAMSKDLFQNSYKIGPGDKIQIKVYGEEDLSFDEILINSSGTFDFPYLGEVIAKGKTAKELKNLIENGLKGDYLINPKVMVNFVSFREIYVNGEVKKPGGYPYQPGLTVDKAIALAGGFTDRASRSKINVTPNGHAKENHRVILNDRVNPGDIIVIEQSFF